MGRKKQYEVHPPQEEIDSIYARNDAFREKVRNERIEKSIKTGKYQTIEEAKEKIGMPSIMSIVKNIAINKSVAKNSLEEKMIALDYIIRNIMEITPMQFYTHYSIANNKKYNLYQVIMSIVDNAPDEIKVECMFDSKMIFFKTMYPEIFTEQIENLSGHDIFFCNDYVKSGLCKAGNTEKAYNAKQGYVYSKEVDDILMDAISSVIEDELELDNVKDIFLFLAQESVIYYEKNPQKPAGINDVISKRGYSSLLDFYYLHCYTAFQVKHAEEFLEVRKKVAKKIPKNDILMEKVENIVNKKSENKDEKIEYLTFKLREKKKETQVVEEDEEWEEKDL